MRRRSAGTVAAFVARETQSRRRAREHRRLRIGVGPAVDAESAKLRVRSRGLSIPAHTIVERYVRAHLPAILRVRIDLGRHHVDIAVAGLLVTVRNTHLEIEIGVAGGIKTGAAPIIVAIVQVRERIVHPELFIRRTELQRMRSKNFREVVRERHIAVKSRLWAFIAVAKSKESDPEVRKSGCHIALRHNACKSGSARLNRVCRLDCGKVEAEVTGAQFVQSGGVERVRVRPAEYLDVFRVHHRETWEGAAAERQRVKGRAGLKDHRAPDRVMRSWRVIQPDNPLVRGAGIGSIEEVSGAETIRALVRMRNVLRGCVGGDRIPVAGVNTDVLVAIEAQSPWLTRR